MPKVLTLDKKRKLSFVLFSLNRLWLTPKVLTLDKKKKNFLLFCSRLIVPLQA